VLARTLLPWGVATTKAAGAINDGPLGMYRDDAKRFFDKHLDMQHRPEDFFGVARARGMDAGARGLREDVARPLRSLHGPREHGEAAGPEGPLDGHRATARDRRAVHLRRDGAGVLPGPHVERPHRLLHDPPA
jgi:hypothetical protein